MSICKTCGGSGKWPGLVKPCPDCHGTGVEINSDMLPAADQHVSPVSGESSETSKQSPTEDVSKSESEQPTDNSKYTGKWCERCSTWYPLELGHECRPTQPSPEVAEIFDRYDQFFVSERAQNNGRKQAVAAIQALLDRTKHAYAAEVLEGLNKTLSKWHRAHGGQYDTEEDEAYDRVSELLDAAIAAEQKAGKQ